jgi:hypothetical protein
MAGHAGNFRIIDKGRKLTKRTNRKEYEIYANPAGLRNIIPVVGRTSQDDQEISDMGNNVIVMQNLFYGIKKQSLLALDIKIGKSTASRSQISESMEITRVGAFFKKVKMKIYDFYTKSSTRGWRAIPVNNGNRAKIGRNSETFLREQFDKIKVSKETTLRNIITQLNLIKDTLDQNQKAFIASSVLIVIDLQYPENTSVKLIDLAYPIDSKSKLYKKYKENFDDGMLSLIAFFRAYAAEQETGNKNNKKYN